MRDTKLYTIGRSNACLIVVCYTVTNDDMFLKLQKENVIHVLISLCHRYSTYDGGNLAPAPEFHGRSKLATFPIYSVVIYLSFLYGVEGGLSLG